MSNLSKLTLSASSPRQPMTPLARKRVKLLRNLDQQIATAEAEARDEEFLQEVKRWVRNEETGEKSLITKRLPVRKWWWQNQHNAWMISLRDGNRLLELGTDKSSVEVGAVDQILQSLETLRDAVIAGELDSQLEAMIAARKPMPKRNEMSYIILFVVLCVVIYGSYIIIKVLIMLFSMLLSNDYAFTAVLVICCTATLVWFW